MKTKRVLGYSHKHNDFSPELCVEDRYNHVYIPVGVFGSMEEAEKALDDLEDCVSQLNSIEEVEELML